MPGGGLQTAFLYSFHPALVEARASDRDDDADAAAAAYAAAAGGGGWWWVVVEVRDGRRGALTFAVGVVAAAARRRIRRCL